MPNGKTHDIISLITSPIIGVITHSITKDIKLTSIILGSYIFASFMFNGDLDTNSRPYNRWWLLKIIWIPYQLIFHHRSIFTHGILIGTIVRLIYLGIIPTIIIYFNNIEIFYDIDSNLILIIFLGLELGSIIHTISDNIF